MAERETDPNDSTASDLTCSSALDAKRTQLESIASLQQAEAASEKPRANRVAVGFFVGLFALSVAGLFSLFWPFITDFILACVLVAIFRVPFERLLSTLGQRRVLASTMATSAIAVFVALPTGFIVTSVSIEAAAFYDSTLSTLTVNSIEAFLFGDEPLAALFKRAADVLGLEWTPTAVGDAVTRVSGRVAEVLYTFISSQVSNIFALGFHFLIILLIAFYMFIDGERLKRYVFETSPLPDDEEELIVRKFAEVGRATLLGNGLGSALQGVIGAISMMIVGLPSPILWGVVMTIFAFLPLVGISIVTLPASIYLALTGRWLAALVFFGFNFIQALMVENVVKTKLIGSHMCMHNLLIFLSVIGGLGLFGVLGLLYGPLIVALFVTLAELYHRHYKPLILGTDGSTEG